MFSGSLLHLEVVATTLEVMLRNFIRNPGRFFYKRAIPRYLYKAGTSALLFRHRRKTNELTSLLPPVHSALRIPRERGFTVLMAPLAEEALLTQRVVAASQTLIQQRACSLAKGKTYLKHVASGAEMLNVQAMREFALHPSLIGAVADYLGELPILASIKLLHSSAVETGFDGSQLYHCDHDDLEQVKVFLHVSDVDQDSGPLTVLPANISQEIRRSLGYEFGGKSGHVPDDVIRNEVVRTNEVQVIGPPGTLALVDTTRVFHFGSRVATRDRYIFYLQFLSRSNFLFNPLIPLLPARIASKLSQPPYVHSLGTDLSRTQRCVLTGLAT